MEKNSEEVAPKDTVMGENTTHGFEYGVFGKWTVRLRNLGGVIAVFTVCINSLLYSWAIHEAVPKGGEWPDRTSLFIIMCGPIICAWAWLDVGKILRILTQSKPVAERLRQKAVSALLRPEDVERARKQPEAPADDTQFPK